ncbi:MAG: MoaD/ThiS family protein [Anaerolineaceae bacterium]|nr:MoaD/ThiS family protein [Anaerolineaceae bacterium]
MITITMIAPFQVQGLQDHDSLQIPNDISVFELLRLSKAPIHAYAFPVSVNSDIVKKSCRLKDGDVVVFVTPISGG